MSDVTGILEAIERGEPKASDELLPLVYEELRKLAATKMAQQSPGQTLQATALVHEAYLRLLGTEPVHWNSRGHFFSAAAEAMRRILIERARKKSAHKHGGGLQRVDLDQVDIALDTDDDLLLLLNDALEEFREKDPTAAELIKLRFFVGLGNQQAAELLGVSERTAKRSWAYARAWLYHRMQDKLPGG
jgi:RNA polymerase sigma factor (TIGR02999 family)